MRGSEGRLLVAFETVSSETHSRAKILGITFCRAHIECASCFRVLNTSCRVCPNGCSRSHATVKWEVSATIDDGTGQAKLYADRDAALLVLGNDLDSRTVERAPGSPTRGSFTNLLCLLRPVFCSQSKKQPFG